MLVGQLKREGRSGYGYFQHWQSCVNNGPAATCWPLLQQPTSGRRNKGSARLYPSLTGTYNRALQSTAALPCLPAAKGDHDDIAVGSQGRKAGQLQQPSRLTLCQVVGGQNEVAQLPQRLQVH